MPMPIYLNVAGTGAVGTAIILDWAVVPFNVSFAVELQAGTATFGVQYTLDDPNAAIDGLTTSTTVTWFNDANAGLPQTASTVGNYAFPIRAIRLNVVSATTATSIQFAVIQGLPFY